MGLFGKILATPFKIVNAPIRAAENLLNGGESVPEEDRVFSKPLDVLANELEEVDDDE